MFKWLIDRGVPHGVVALVIRPLALGALGVAADAGLLDGQLAEHLARLFG